MRTTILPSSNACSDVTDAHPAFWMSAYWTYAVYQFNPMIDSQLYFKRVTIVRLVSYQAFRLFITDKTPGDSRFNKGDVVLRSRRNEYGDRTTITVCNYHDFRTLAPLGHSNLVAPFLAMANVPSMKHSDRSSSSLSRKSVASVWRMHSKIPERTHCRNLRWQVWYGRYLARLP